MKAGKAVIVVHGLDPSTLSTKAQAAKSDLVPSLPLAATSPALCGALVAAEANEASVVDAQAGESTTGSETGESTTGSETGESTTGSETGDAEAQVTEVPAGGADTGDGTPAGADQALLFAGGGLLLAAGGVLGARRRAGRN